MNRRQFFSTSAAAVAVASLPTVAVPALLNPVQAAPRREFGGPSDLWGHAWTVEEINASGFGFSIPAGARIDHVQIEIIYDRH